MKIHCQIFSESRETLEASVFVSTIRNKRIIMKFHELMGYEIDLDVKTREVITFEIHKEGFESLVCKNFARKEGYIFVLGERGVKYMRYGDSVIPRNNYEDLIYISGYGGKFEKYINQFELEKIVEYNEKILNTEGVYRLKPQNTSKVWDIIKNLRQSNSVQSVGYIAAIAASHIVFFSDHLKVYFKKQVSQYIVEKLVKQLNLAFVQDGQEDTYSIVSIGKDSVDDLFNCIEKIYQTGLVDLIFPLTMSTFPPDSLPDNFLWKGQYEHAVIEVKDAWSKLGIAKGVRESKGFTNYFDKCIPYRIIFSKKDLLNYSFLEKLSLLYKNENILLIRHYMGGCFEIEVN